MQLGQTNPWGNQGTAVKQKTSTVLTQAVMAQVKPKVVVKPVEDTKFAEIKANPFFQIYFNEKLDENQKAEEAAKSLTESSIKELLLFKDWLAHTREKMASDLIKLNDPESMSEVQQVYTQMGDDLKDFEEKAKPFTEILESLYTLRTNGITFDALNEIKERKKKEVEVESAKNRILSEVSRLQSEVETLADANARKAQEKTLFGYGKITTKAAKEIASNQLRLDKIASDLVNEQNKLAELDKLKGTLNVPTDERFTTYSKEIESLRQLVDISAPEHRKRAEELQNAALKFIEVSKERVGSVSNKLEAREEQIARFKKASKNMSLVYATMNESVNRAFDLNVDKSKVLSLANSEGETLLSKATREQKKESVDEFVKILETVKTDTVTSFAKVSAQGAKVNNMKDANDQQRSIIRNLRTDGIAEVAEGSSVLLEGIAGAGLSEASSMAKEILGRMNQRTNNIAQSEVIKQAMSVRDTAKDVESAFESISQIGETLTAATSIRREALSELRASSELLRNKAREVVELTQESMGVNAETSGGTTSPKEIKVDPVAEDVFGLKN